MHPVSHNDESENSSRFINLNDRYDHLGSLGAGGMAIVYKARDRQLDRIVAIKRLSLENYTEGMIPRFEREARALATLSHPNIVDVYDSGLDEEHWPFLVMDFIEGETLDELIADGKLSDLDKIIEIFAQLLDGLGHAHSKGIVHRDLKPGNVMIKGALNSDRFVVKLMDFGIAKTNAKDSDSAFRTQLGLVLGSPLYMSPEQTVTPDVDQRSDIYSVGCMLYETLTRRPPFRGANMLETMTMHRSTPAEKIANQIGHLPKAAPVAEKIEVVVRKAMEKSPKDRYQNCGELRAALREVQKLLREVEIAELDARKAKARSMYARIALAVCALGLTGLAVFGLLAIMESDIKPPAPKKEISTDLNVVAAREGMLGRTWNDYWVSFDKPEQKLELKPDIKFTDLPRAKVKTVAVGHRIEQTGDKKSDYIRDISGISYLTNLRRINVKNMELDEANIKEICKIKTLEDILITDTPLPAGSARYLAALPNLRHLALENCSLQAQDVKSISNLSLLIKLSLDGNDLNNPAVLKPVSKMRALTSLSLSDSSVTDAGIDGIYKLPNVTTLKIDGRLLTLAAMKKIAQMRNLEFVMVSLSKKLDDRAIGELSKLPKLKRLDLERCPNVTDGCIDSLIRMRSLEVLRILGTSISDEAVVRLKSAKPGIFVKHSSFEDLRGVGAPDENK